MRLTVPATDRELLREELRRFLQAVDTPEAQARYQGLDAAIDDGLIEGKQQIEALTNLLEIALESGATRRLHSPQAERALLRLYGSTPRGAEIAAASRQANHALSALAGQRLEVLSFTPGLPGAHRLKLATDRCEILLEIDREGVRAKSVAVSA